MYDYFLLDNFSNSSSHAYRYGCREYLIKSYALRTMLPVEDSVFYFGHVNSNFSYDYSKLCNEVWKGQVPFEIVKLKDIPVCPNNPPMFHDWLRDFGEKTLVKIGNNIHPPDISLILYVSWYGKTFNMHNEVKQYYFAKVYSDLIPNFYTGDNNAMRNSLINGNGPERYMSRLSGDNYSSYSQIRDLASTHATEWCTIGGKPIVPLTNTHDFVRWFKRYPSSNSIFLNRTTNKYEVWERTYNDIPDKTIREYRNNYYTYRNNFKGQI